MWLFFVAYWWFYLIAGIYTLFIAWLFLPSPSTLKRGYYREINRKRDEDDDCGW